MHERGLESHQHAQRRREDRPSRPQQPPSTSAAQTEATPASIETARPASNCVRIDALARGTVTAATAV